MARAENEALVRQIFDAFAQKRGFALRDVFADDATWTVPGSGSMAGTFSGREEIFAFLGRLPKETGGTYSSSLIDVLASDDRAAALYRASGERQRPPARARPGAAVPDRERARPGGARAAERSGRVRDVLGPMSDLRFADGLRYRVEIPSVEGPGVMRAVLAEAAARGVPVRRVSQGSGVMMLTDVELDEMAQLGSENGVEVSLFLGPRGAWDTGGQSLVTSSVGVVARGDAGVDECIAEVERGIAHGIRSFLVGDLGALATLGRLRGGRRPPAQPRAQDVRPAARAPTAPLLACCRSAVQRRSTSRQICRSRTSPGFAAGARHRSTSTWRCPTTRAGSCGSTRCPR